VSSPLAKHVPVDNTKIKMGNPLAKHVVLASTTIWLDNPLNPLDVKIVPPASTTAMSDNPMNPLPANFAVLANTITSQDNSIALSAPPEPPTQALATPTAKHALPEDFSSTTKI
jgi:hypothetical protein